MAASGKSKDELIIDANKTDLVTNAKTRIESLYGVNIEFDFVFRDKEDNAAQQWISVTGNKEDVKLAKDYIKSLSNPLESTSIQFPTELFSPLTDEIVWNRLEKESNAVLFFPTKDTVQINGSDTLSVTLAMSALEDIINHFVAYGETELEPISPLIARQTSQRLDDELRRLSSENDGSLILSDTDRTCMKDEVKRAILECIHDPPRRHSPEDFVTHGGFVDIRSKDKDQKLLPPEHFSIAATNAAPAHPYTSENTEVMTLHPARYNLDLMEDMRFTGASDTTPAMATLELNLNLTEDTVSGHSAAPAASSSAEDDALDGAIMAAGLDVSADEKDKALWTFALDQGYNRAEVDNVFRTLGARIKTRDFVKQLVKNRTHHENSLGQGPVSPVLNENGFPKKLPVPPSQDRLQSSPQMRHKKSNNQSGGSHSPDTSLPVDYLELFEEEGMSGAQLKRRNEERRKILRAALDTEPQVRLNSKSGAKSPVKQAKKKKVPTATLR